ncbi:MAG: flagellar basal body L-ring protein FlgH [Candidatus Brocadiales bacterium]
MKIKLTFIYTIFLLTIINCTGCPYGKHETFPLLCSTASGSSLWKRRAVITSNLYIDNRARALGDIVTVLIREDTELKGKETTDLNKQNSINANITANNFFTGILKNHSSSFNEYLPNIESNIKDAFKGDGSYVSTRGVDLKMTAIVTDILPSGNLVIEGTRTVSVNKETYTIRLSGIARQVDIMNTFRDIDGVFRNVIRSTSLANASITIEGKGFLTRAGKRGWFWRVRDLLWPF